MRTVLLALLLAACGGSSKKPAPEAPPPEEHAEIENTVEEEPAPAPEDELTQWQTGAADCDALIARTMCSYDKAGAAMPAEAKKAFEDSVDAWRQALENESTRQATMDACKMALDAANDGFAAQGC